MVKWDESKNAMRTTGQNGETVVRLLKNSGRRFIWHLEKAVNYSGEGIEVAIDESKFW